LYELVFNKHDYMHHCFDKTNIKSVFLFRVLLSLYTFHAYSYVHFKLGY